MPCPTVPNCNSPCQALPRHTIPDGTEPSNAYASHRSLLKAPVRYLAAPYLATPRHAKPRTAPPYCATPDDAHASLSRLNQPAERCLAALALPNPALPGQATPRRAIPYPTNLAKQQLLSYRNRLLCLIVNLYRQGICDSYFWMMITSSPRFHFSSSSGVFCLPRMSTTSTL